MPPIVRAQLDYYALLEVAPSASTAEINHSFRRVAWRCHPDRNQTPGATQEFQTVNEGRQVLIDPVRRAAYDARRLATPHTHPNCAQAPLAHRGHHRFHQHHHHAHPLVTALFVILLIPSAWLGIFASMTAAHSGSMGEIGAPSSSVGESLFLDRPLSIENLQVTDADERNQPALAWDTNVTTRIKGPTLMFSAPEARTPNVSRSVTFAAYR